MTREVVCDFTDGSVGAKLAGMVELEKHALVLVRARDSQREPQLIVAAFLRLGISSRAVSCGALVDLSNVGLEALSSALFGFDELWIGGATTDWRALASTPPLTSDCVILSKDDCAPFKDGLLQSGAQIALADGCGLNVVRVLAHD